jgi:hypothetical protein
MQQVF